MSRLLESLRTLKTGKIAGLDNGGTHDANGITRPSATDQCHDITVYAEIGLAAGACSGNGILLDIRDPVNPKRVEAVNDTNLRVLAFGFFFE